jgi:hypothetical protein
MATSNPKAKSPLLADDRLAGGYGPHAARQPEEMQLRRLVMACLLWEDIAYADGQSVAEAIQSLVPKVDPARVAQMAIEARYAQKLRHAPLLLVREMARHESHKSLVAETLATVINRPDELCEFVALYWKDNGGKRSLSAQAKKGLARAFLKFDEYQLAKYAQEKREVKLRDVLFLCHARPRDEALFKRLADRTLAVPDTWEVGLSASKTPQEKRDVWVRLIESNRLGALAFLKNLRNLQAVEVPRQTIAQGFAQLKPGMLLPIDFLRAAQFAPDWTEPIESLMLRCAGEFPKLAGQTIFVVDVSGSMQCGLSSRGRFRRLDAAAAMAILASEMSEQVTIYATAGSDTQRKHKTVKLERVRGFALARRISDAASQLGGGGIFTRQCLEAIHAAHGDQTPDRIVIFSDSQDCDHPNQRIPEPFGKRNYIVDVSSHQHGLNYAGVWTAEISGWSEHFLRFIAELERPMDAGTFGFTATTGA